MVLKQIPDEACEVRQVDPEKVTQGKALLLPDDAYAVMAESFRALADTSRVKIVHTLLQQELCVCDLAAVAGISESATSQHLRVLRNLRLVKSRRRSPWPRLTGPGTPARPHCDVSPARAPA